MKIFLLLFVLLSISFIPLKSQEKGEIYNEVVEKFINEYKEDSCFKLWNDTLYIVFVDDNDDEITCINKDDLILHVGNTHISYVLPSYLDNITGSLCCISSLMQENNNIVKIRMFSYWKEKGKNNNEAILVLCKNIDNFFKYDELSNTFSFSKKKIIYAL